jgi:hypothetical protein
MGTILATVARLGQSVEASLDHLIPIKYIISNLSRRETLTSYVKVAGPRIGVVVFFFLFFFFFFPIVSNQTAYSHLLGILVTALYTHRLPRWGKVCMSASRRAESANRVGVCPLMHTQRPHHTGYQTSQPAEILEFSPESCYE